MSPKTIKLAHQIAAITSLTYDESLSVAKLAEIEYVGDERIKVSEAAKLYGVESRYFTDQKEKFGLIAINPAAKRKTYVIPRSKLVDYFSRQ